MTEFIKIKDPITPDASLPYVLKKELYFINNLLYCK